MQSLLTSDLHLGHKAIIKYRPQFKTMKDHDDFLIDQILKLDKRTVLTILGDFLFDGEHYDEYIQRLSKKKCRIKLVMGNHDSLKLMKEPIFEIQLPLYSYKNIWVSHCPIHPDELRGRLGNIHGHLHNEVVVDRLLSPDNRYFNVNVDVNSFKFVEFEKIKEMFNA